MHAWLNFRCLALLPALLLVGAASAQDATEESEIPEPEAVVCQTKDGVSIHCTYYAGTLGKKAAPIILLHGWDGQGSDYEALALAIQAAGHAAITPDLRGFGRSKSYRVNGVVKPIDPDTFRNKAIEAMNSDVEAVRKFLLQKNNAGELNIEALCIVGADFSTIIALNYARYNWEQPVLPAYKLGQDVKAIVLLSPVSSFKGATTREALAHPIVRGKLSTFIAVGKQDSKAFSEAKRLEGSLKAFHPKVSDDPDEQRAKLDLFFVTPETTLQGVKLLDNGLPVASKVLGFINLRLVEKMDDFPWQNRESPL